LASLLYLLNESIDDSETILIPDLETAPIIKREIIADLNDYISAIQHRILLSQEIQKRLKERN
ncbi:MAG: hypothetical protein AAFU64_15685, partial [Bacteroidota bacterium]